MQNYSVKFRNLAPESIKRNISAVFIGVPLLEEVWHPFLLVHYQLLT